MKKILLFFTICLLNQTLKAQDEFITIWQSTEEYPSITIPTYDNEVYHYRVNWGDGSSTLNVNGDYSHEYAAPGNYTVTITGVFPGIHFGKIHDLDNPYNETGILSVEQWGNNQWKSMQGAFYGQKSLVINANDIPDLSLTSSLKDMFRFCRRINNGTHNRWNEWDTSTITNMSALFYLSNFNQPIGNWDVSNVTKMSSMFRNCRFHQDISNWDVSNVTDMSVMFFQSTLFNQDLSSWNVSNVTRMIGMFAFSSFNQSLSNWNLTSLTTMVDMFKGAQISETNYDKTLTGWKNNANTPNNITLGAVGLNYCRSKIDRQFLIDTKGWTIIGDNEYCDPANGFVTIWQSTEAYPSIEIPTYDDEVYNYYVNWGDGSVSNNVDGDITHEYAATGNYTVTITGVFPGINFGKIYDGDNPYNEAGILSIEKWGNHQWKTMSNAFFGQTSLVINATDIPDLSLCSSFNQAFLLCSSINNGSHNRWNEWDTSTITDMYQMFLESNFNQPIGNWDLTNVTSIIGMFTQSDFNQPIENWNLANVTSIASLFSGSSFNQNINNWDVSNITDMRFVFSDSNFNQPLNNWNVSNVTNMYSMFSDSSFNQNINNWDVSNVTAMTRMFASTNFNQDLNNWNVSNVESMSRMFASNNSFNRNIDNWNVGNVRFMNSMFKESIFNQNINNWNVSSVENMSNMFSNSSFNKDLNNWDVSFVRDMSNMFSNSLFNRNISNWNVSNVTDMSKMFYNTPFNQNISNWNVGSVTDMNSMFAQSNFNQNINNWNISRVRDMSSMFSEAISFNQPLNNWNVSRVRDMSNMFSYSSFNQNINNWDVINVTNMSAMFKNVHAYNQPINNWDVSSVTNMAEMFLEANSFNQPLNNWNVTNVTDMSFLFKKAISFNQPIKVWNVGSVTNMSSMFNSATSFNQTINSWDVRNVTNMANMFTDAISFNMPLNDWVPFSVQSMEAMFKNAITFDQNIGSWDIKNITSCVEMFNGVTLSNTNYEALLIGWNNRDLTPNIVFDGGNSNYFTNESVAAKHNMITNDNWTITDGGKTEQIIWTGANSTDWNDPGNWDVNSVPTQYENVVLADVENAPIINTDENHTVNKLINDETLAISTNASLTVLGDINQKNTISISSSGFSNGSLIVKGNQISINPPDVIYDRFVTGNEWHLISSPVTGFNIDTFVADSPLNEEEQGNVKSLGFYNNHSNPNWSYYKVDDNPGNFISGKGYSVNTSVKTLLSFRGKLMGDNLSNYPITDNFSGWNLVGNPYTAFINLNTAANENENFLEKNAGNFDPAFATIYIWNPNTTSYEPLGNGLGAKYIAPGQGFFVKSKNNVGEINISKSMLSHQSNNLFLKENITEKIVLQINNNTTSSETTIAFKEDMTNSLDISYDAAVFSGESKNLSIYTHLIEDNDNIPFAIQFLPELGKYNSIVPIGISQVGFSEITLSLKDSNISPSAYIYLEDKVENTFTEISTSTNYKFHLRTEAPETGRFFLHFQANPLSINEFDTSKINIYKDNNNALQIKGISKGLLNMYSITGQNVLKNYKLKKQSENIHLENLAQGVYLIKIKTKERKFTKKIIF